MHNKDRLIKKLFNNQCSKTELERLFKLLEKDTSENPPEVMDELFKQLEEVSLISHEKAKKRVLEQVRAAQKEMSLSSGVGKKPERRILLFRNLGAAAAVILLLITVYFSIQYFQSPALISHHTAFGEIENITLPDGSTVALNGNSSLKFKPDWSEGETRVVYLDGEAYFEVEKKPKTQAKFEVITSDLRVKVLGTKFNVNTRNTATRVFLEEGKVELTLEDKAKSALVLAPGEMAKYSASNDELIKPKQIESKLELSWKIGVLEFREASLQEILEKFSASHKLNFKIVDEELAQRVFTLSIPTNDLDLAIELLRSTIGCKISKVKDEYIFELMDPKTI